MTVSINPVTFNPHDPAFLANPYPTYAWFRANRPVSWVTPYNTWWCFNYDDCVRILTGTDLFLKNNPVPSAGPPPPIAGVLASMPESVFSLDNPRHDEVRPILDGLFATAIASAVPRAEAVAQQLLVAAKASWQFDLMSSYALPLPSGVLQQVLGVPAADFAGIENWVAAIVAANDITAPMAVRMGGLTCSMALNAYYQALARCPMHDPNAMFDLMRTRGTTAPKGLSVDEVQTNAVTLSIAGYWSTTFLIGAGTLNLLQHPAQLERLRA
ncbi:MAG: cytochrome P450, partial [Gemmatimonadetes bacterium]|nr:cytochrome P450 [Gemmatimonadota bacterium]